MPLREGHIQIDPNFLKKLYHTSNKTGVHTVEKSVLSETRTGVSHEKYFEKISTLLSFL